MSRFDDNDGEGIPWGLWEQMVSTALGGKQTQAALADLEQALLDLPTKKLVYGHLAGEGSVCAVGAYVAIERAKRTGISFQDAVAMLNESVYCECGHTYADHVEGGCRERRRRYYGEIGPAEVPCECGGFLPQEEFIGDTADAGRAAGLKFTVAWHLAYLNDEKFADITPEERYERVLGWVQRALGKVAA